MIYQIETFSKLAESGEIAWRRPRAPASPSQILFKRERFTGDRDNSSACLTVDARVVRREIAGAADHNRILQRLTGKTRPPHPV
ncbi:hypothetical protein [Bradyrhizobium sp. LMG 9283]|uniref:hypothetical protein n=1 Tax=Bradyrhizobium sp. LMG 9283 TaxID=592064 RepID=UPI00388D272B